MDRSPVLTNWTEKYAKKFDELSPHAKAIASYEWIRNYEQMRTQISFRRGESLAPGFPPVSDTKGELTLLHPEIIKEYFKQYNKNLMKNRNSIDIASRNPGHASLMVASLKSCKG